MDFSSATPFLVEHMVGQGIPAEQAKQAADRCVRAIIFSGAGGYLAGQLAGPALVAIFVNPPAAVALLGVGGAAAVGAMAYQVGFGNACSDVRNAVFNWNLGKWNESSLQPN